MDNNWNVSAAVIDTFIEEVYENYLSTWFLISSLTLVFYVALSKLPEEVEHIWFKPFSPPTLLYIFARYPVVIFVGLQFFENFVPPGRSCNITANALNIMGILSYIGIQGLLIARAYSLCKGTKILMIPLAFLFLVELFVLVYGSVTSSGCRSSSAEISLIALGQNIVSVIMDAIIFGICIWKVWGTWKLKRQAGIQSGSSLVSTILKQSILRCCFAIGFSITHAILLAIDIHSSMLFAEQDFDFFSDVLSSILVAEFTLDLRRLNSAKITASNISLPTLQFSNVLQHAHQSILVEMSTPEEEEEGGGHDDFPESVNDMDIQPVQESNV